MKNTEYYLGLDMGTSSVGWAVTDENYRLLRVKGKDIWGIREFDEASSAAERRMNRTSRRRRQREVVRLGLLKSYFDEAISKKDALFFQRLENSKYHLEDKDTSVRTKTVIFNDENYCDSDYFKEYPTIFHLRKELITNTAEHDVRLVYLAIANMFKHRGHFLNTGLSDNDTGKGLYESYVEFCQVLQEEIGISLSNDIDSETFEKILTGKEYNRTKKAEELTKLLNIESKDKQRIGFIRAICGLKVSAKQLFSKVKTETEENDAVIELVELDWDDEKKIDINFTDYGYEEKQDEIAEALGEQLFAVVESMKMVYDASVLENIKGEYSYLSEARVAEYEKHRNDLKILKNVVKKYAGKEEYNKFFREEEAGTYSAYVKSFNSDKKLRRNMEGRTREDLYKSIKQLLKAMPEEDEDVCYIKQELEKEKFLPKQLTRDNGVIPNQVHTQELQKILMNAESYLPFLKEKDESGLTISERIVRLFKFQIPYYIGPTSEESTTGWVKRKECGPVFPWNLEQKIDVKETSKEFILKMIRECTYINGEKVLPKASLEYESFCVLNEINNIKIDGEKISPELKQEIYNVLFKKGKKVTHKQLIKFLVSRGKLQDEMQLSGVDININSSLSTYGKFRAVLGDAIDNDDCKKMVEDIVRCCTLFGNAKEFLRKEIEEKYAGILSEEQIKRILSFKFKDWGQLSKEFLELRGCDKTVGESVSLIRMMWDTNLNLMELLNSSQYTYKEALEEKRQKAWKTLQEMQPEDLDEFYFSAPVKRMVWQTLLIIKELEKVLGAPPKRIFVEMTRKPDENPVRTIPRKQKFIELYKSIQDESRDWKAFIEKADASGMLRSKKMYLYLTQQGKCMYTGEEIPFNDLFKDNLYDIDHIYPRHFVKDDNIDNNLVLVKKNINARKSDTYPLEEGIRNKRRELWKYLLTQKLISEEKYRRLTGTNPFTEEQMAGFIARQLVETSQGTKSVTEILRKALPNTTIVFSKASNVAEFRQKRKIVKCRSVNEFHHAHDAYLNIVVGNVYYVKFTQNPLHFIKKEYGKDANKHSYHLGRMFDWDVIRGEEVAWIGPVENGHPGTIVTVKEMLDKNTPLMTRRSFEQHGAIANETLYSARKAKASPENYISLKSCDERLADVKKYGGFTSISGAYFFLVEHEVKEKKVRTLEMVPIYLRDKLEGNMEALQKYCIDNLSLINPNIRMKKIKFQSLIKKDGYFVHISGRSGNRIFLRNAVNLCLCGEWISYIKQVEKSVESGNLREEITSEKNIELYEILMKKHVEGIYAKRPNAMGEKLAQRQELFVTLSIENQCKTLLQIIGLSRIGVVGADLTLLKEASKCGVMTMQKKISEAKEFILINQSVTGLFENKIDLLTV